MALSRWLVRRELQPITFSNCKPFDQPKCTDFDLLDGVDQTNFPSCPIMFSSLPTFENYGVYSMITFNEIGVSGRTSPLRSPSNPRFPRAQTMSTIREASEQDSDAQRGHFSRAKTFGLARHAPDSPGSPLSKQGGAKAEIVPEATTIGAPPAAAYSRAKTLGTLREVIYLDSPNFARPNLKRAKTLSTLLKEPQDATVSHSLNALEGTGFVKTAYGVC